MKRILIIDGPNGAGKTTFAREYLPQDADCPRFINADLIAAGLSPFDPAAAAVQAGRVMIEEMRRLVALGESFAFLRNHAQRPRYARQIPKWQRLGYRVESRYLKRRNVRVAIARVRTRVIQGGHDIPRQVITRRFAASWRNFGELYQSLVDYWELYYNSTKSPVDLKSGSRE